MAADMDEAKDTRLGVGPIDRSVLLEFLELVDSSFPIPLSDKVEIGDYTDKLLDSATLVWAVEAGRLVGLVAGYTERVPETGLGYVSLVAVDEHFRRKGIAQRLICAFLDIAAARGLTGVHLYADPSNRGACALYESLGFRAERFSCEKRSGDVHYLRLVNKTALVTAVGSFSAGAVISGLRRLGYRVIGCDIHRAEEVANSSEVDAFYRVPLVSSGEEYVGALRRVISVEGVSLVLPLTDVEVDALSDARGQLGAIVCIPGKEAVRVCRDKLSSSRVLAPVLGSSLIPTELLSDVDPAVLDYPVVCKPIDGRSSEGLFFAASSEELRVRTSGLDAVRCCVQPKVEGRVVTVDVVRSSASGGAVAVPRLELLRTPNGAGTSVFVFEDADVSELAMRIAEELGVNGCVNVEFIVTRDGSLRFLECNPRFSGGVEFTCMSGYDCVRNHVRCFLGLDIDSPGPVSQKFVARSYVAHDMGEGGAGIPWRDLV